jgi:hypothetical protein
MITNNSHKLGHYQVGEEILYSKPRALLQASKDNSKIVWDFNTQFFVKQDWSTDPEPSLRELYRLRAQQLRDTYDYIRIECSGGPGSTTALYSFLLNNIHVDEVVFRYPKIVDNNSVDPAWNTTAINYLAELEYTINPLFDWIKNNFPKTWAHVQDYSKFMLENNTLRDINWIHCCGHHMNPSSADKHNPIQTIEHKKIADTGKSIGVIYGIDNPKVGLINHGWYCYFTDVKATYPNPVTGIYTNINSELFFCSPDMPELVVKQAHMIKNWFDQPGNGYLQEILSFPSRDTRHRASYENITKAIIYPDYDLATWQADKPKGNFYSEMDYWFFRDFRNSELYHGWKNGVDYFVNQVDRKYLDSESGKILGPKPMYCPYFYYLGESSQINNTLAFENRNHIDSFWQDYKNFIKFVKNKTVEL